MSFNGQQRYVIWATTVEMVFMHESDESKEKKPFEMIDNLLQLEL